MGRVLPPLRLLTVFEAVSRLGGVKPAAMEMNVSQPAISQALRQLEDHLGAKLLDRSTRPAGLTEAGRLLREATVEGLGRIAGAIEEIGRLGTGTDMTVTIACSVGFATYWLMPRLASFYERYPEIQVNVRTTPQGAPHLTAGIDIAIRYGGGLWEDGEVRLLFKERVDPVCSPALSGCLGEDRWLDVAPLIHVDVEDESWLSWSVYLRATGRADSIRRGLRFTNYVQATQAALSGQGIMLGWRSITGDLVRDGRLIRAADAPFVPSDAFYLASARQPRSVQPCSIVGRWLLKVADDPGFRGDGRLLRDREV